MKRIAVFASGGGTDFQSIIDAVKTGGLKAEIGLLVAGREGIFAAERARLAGIPVAVFAKKDYPSLSDMYEDVLKKLAEERIDFIVLAGYLNILTPNIVSAYKKRIVNIHPALIPAYSGVGYYGMRVHEAVVKNREKFSGATVHYVDEGADTGEIIAQERVPVLETDTAETLAARVLELEHRLLPDTLKKLLNDK